MNVITDPERRTRARRRGCRRAAWSTADCRPRMGVPLGVRLGDNRRGAHRRLCQDGSERRRSGACDERFACMAQALRPPSATVVRRRWEAAGWSAPAHWAPPAADARVELEPPRVLHKAYPSRPETVLQVPRAHLGTRRRVPLSRAATTAERRPPSTPESRPQANAAAAGTPDAAPAWPHRPAARTRKTAAHPDSACGIPTEWPSRRQVVDRIASFAHRPGNRRRRDAARGRLEPSLLAGRSAVAAAASAAASAADSATDAGAGDPSLTSDGQSLATATLAPPRTPFEDLTRHDRDPRSEARTTDGTDSVIIPGSTGAEGESSSAPSSAPAGRDSPAGAGRATAQGCSRPSPLRPAATSPSCAATRTARRSATLPGMVCRGQPDRDAPPRLHRCARRGCRGLGAHGHRLRLRRDHRRRLHREPRRLPTPPATATAGPHPGGLGTESRPGVAGHGDRRASPTRPPAAPTSSPASSR